MSELGKYHETESLGNNQYQTTIGVKPIAFLQSTGYKRINSIWQEAGNGRFVVDNAPFRVLTHPTGGRRFYPIRDDFDRWIEIGRPRTKVVTQWQEMNHGALACKDNALSGSRINTGLDIVHGGHFISWELELKNRPLLGIWKPTDNLLAFPYELMGLDFKGNVLYADGKPVMRMRSPVVFDRGGEDARSVKWEHQTLDGQRCLLYTLPDISGMKRPVVDPTLELQPDAAAGKDTILRSADPDNNYGISPNYWVDTNRHSLIEFDVSSIPVTNIVTSATLTLKNDDASVKTQGVHKGLVEWYEGTKDGAAPGATDGSTWNHRNANTGGQVAWTSGAGGAAGTEFEAVATTTFVPSGATIVITGLSADVQSWVITSASNYGWWIVHQGTTDSWKALTSDNATAANRPKLVVVYTAGGAGARLINLTPFNHKRRVF